MIVFVIPLKSKKVSNSWEKVCKLLEGCLRSICNQTDQDFHVVVACHEKPEIDFEHSKISYVQVDFPSPQRSDTPAEKMVKGVQSKASYSIDSLRQDRARKAIEGLRYTGKFNPNYVMFVDADDRITTRLVEFVKKQPECNGWFVNSGYVYQSGSPLIYYRKSHFNRWCGTCNIINFKLLPLHGEKGVFPQELLNYYDSQNHRNIANILESQGNPIKPLPMPGAVYIIGNNENIYQTGFSTIHDSNQNKPLFLLKELLKFRLFSPAIRREFSFA